MDIALHGEKLHGGFDAHPYGSEFDGSWREEALVAHQAKGQGA